MSCDLRIELEDGDRPRSFGEALRGHLHVSVTEEVVCRGITIRLRWRTEGESHPDERDDEELSLIDRELSLIPGEPVVLPFELRIPTSGPVTYAGPSLTIEWQVCARVRVPWALDPQLCRAIRVRGFAADEADRRRRAEQRLGKELVATAPLTDPWSSLWLLGSAKAQLGLGALIVAVFSLLLLVGFSAFEMVGVRIVDRAIFLVSSSLLLVAVVLGVGAALVFWARRRIAMSRTGPISVEVEPLGVHSGDCLGISLQFTPRRAVPSAVIEARLECWEKALYRYGVTRFSNYNRVHRAQIVLQTPAALAAGEPIQRSGRIEVPTTGPPSFVSSSNQVQWFLVIHVRLARWLVADVVSTVLVLPPFVEATPVPDLPPLPPA